MSKAPTRKTPSPALARPVERTELRDSANPAEMARYIASFTGELSSLAKQSGLDLLGYLLDMARLEAEKQARGKH